MRVAIKDIAYHLPEFILTNEALHEENPTWDMNALEMNTGVQRRHIAREDETALDLAVEACNKLFSNNKEDRGQIDSILFCTVTADHVTPSNACILHKILGLSENVFALDFSVGCAGYIYGLAMAQGLIKSGLTKNTLLVTADTLTKYVHPQDHSTRLVFGDAAAVSWITGSNSTQGIFDIQCCTSGDTEKIVIPAGGCRMPKSDETAIPETDYWNNVRTLEDIRMDGFGILRFVRTKVTAQIRGILAANGLTIEDIDMFVFHQASQMALNCLARTLKIDADRLYSNLYRVGNTVGASIPIALKDALDSGKVTCGDKVLLCGFGTGLSWGSAIIEI